jgi:D-tyrosyl-tRNA(Tyr) deacylase
VRAVIQRVSSATVTVEGDIVGSIGRGLCAFVGATHTDGPPDAERLAERIWGLRIFEDDSGLINLSAQHLGLEVLVVSQFTVYADTSRGRRPSFANAASPERAEPLIEAVATHLRALGAKVETGRFRSMMSVALVNEGPFTIVVDSGR